MDQDLIEEIYVSSESSDSEDDSDSNSESEDTGNRRSWDPHAGMKPSRRHGRMSDDEVDLEVEDELPYGADTEVNSAMVDLLWELGDVDIDDPRDVDWLPPKLRKKPGTTGMISPTEPRS